ncbi:MAG: hypothetical protein KJO54_08540, partial [Gammaproteobacteria bacterium]|nr:hypothetical protein [Gammaproteobacteria bacterium]
MKTTTLSTLISMLLLSAGAHAEISGSGSPNVACAANLAGVLWHDLNGDGIADAGEPGLPGISLQLFEEDGVGGALNATTDATGNYQFGNLCEGEYLAVINESTVPDGLIAGTNGDNDDDEDEEDLGGWNLEIDDDDDNESSVRLDLGYVGCPLSVESSCRVASLASELYACEKPVHELSVTWAGEQAIRLVAHRGNRDADVLADIDNVVQGQTVTVSGLEDAGSSSTWEIFVAGTELKLGESRFHLECGDVEMNGPEDCGLPQGNDKDNKSDLVNDWRLEGIVDDSGELRCTQAEASTSECQLQGQWADCKMLDKVRHLTFVYSGGGCAASDHAQPDK